MRGLAVLPELVRFDSADSTNVARNHCAHREQFGEYRAAYLAQRTEAKIEEGLQAAELEPALPISNFENPPNLRPALKEPAQKALNL